MDERSHRPDARTRDTLPVSFFPTTNCAPVEWHQTDGLVSYPDAVAAMEQRVTAIAGGADECVWLLEHPPLYTAGTSANTRDLLSPEQLPVFNTGRGGEFTYHGPGQRVAYVMLDLKRRQADLRRFVAALEQWIIESLKEFQIHGERREDRVGVWVGRPDKPLQPDGSFAEDKIAAIGIRVRRWVSFHGISVNVEPNLAHYGGIVPCGVTGHGVTSLADLGLPVALADFDRALYAAFNDIFGPVSRPVYSASPEANGSASSIRQAFSSPS